MDYLTQLKTLRKSPSSRSENAEEKSQARWIGSDKTDKSSADGAAPTAYIHRCPRCNGANWGYVRIEHDVLPSGERRPYEVWECLACHPPQRNACPHCAGVNLVIDSKGVCCVDCWKRPKTP